MADRQELARSLRQAVLRLNKQVDSDDATTISGLAERSRIETAIGEHIAEMRAAGFTDEEILYTAGSPEEGSGVPAPASSEAPTEGSEAWGRWSLSDDAVSLELRLDDGVRAKGLALEIKDGWLRVGPSADAEGALLIGRLMQPVAAGDVTWAIEDADGGRLLCIELPKKETAKAAPSALATCIFAPEGLRIRGERVPPTPGLSQGTMSLSRPE